MKYLHREVARAANKKSHRINHFFGGRYKWSVIGQENYYWNSIRYVFQNPTRAGLCNSVYDYKFSSLNSPAKNFSWHLTNSFYDKRQQVTLEPEWLDTPINPDHQKLIQSGLRRTEFKLPKNSNGYLSKFDTPLPKKGTVT